MTESIGKILVVDDDKNIRELIRLYLQKENYEVIVAHTGTEGVELFALHQPDLILLDVMLPYMDGWQVLTEIRKSSVTPIIMLTAKGETMDKVTGLDLGADDYIVKPFDPVELVARVKAILRRFKAADGRAGEIAYDGFVIDLDRHYMAYHGNETDLPPKEMELLYFLAAHPNKVFTREQLLEKVWGFEYFGDSRTVDVHVKRLREKFDNEQDVWQIKTVWGVGYKFEVSI